MISVLTPTFNRGYILPNLYKSLLKQTSKDFEWIVIDDGSTDNTRTILEEWNSQKNSFEINYVFQENGGKHRAVNRGVNYAKFEYCIIVDSDDFLKETAIERIIDWVQSIHMDTSFAGVSGLKGHIGGGLIGGYPRAERFQDYIDANNLQRQKLNLVGDKAEVYRTEILRRYPFPEFKGENFLSEAVVWDSIARDGYKIRWFNEIIYFCEYLDDGLTRNVEKKYIDNFEGYTFYIRQILELYDWLPRQFVAGAYVKIAKQKGLTFCDSAKRLGMSEEILCVAYMICTVKDTVKSLVCLIKNLRKVMGNSNE